MQQSRHHSAFRRLGLLSGLVLCATHSGADTPQRPTHVVPKGETLGSIAQEHDVAVGAVRAENPIADQSPLRVGHRLRLPATAHESDHPRSDGPAVDRHAHGPMLPRNGVRMKAGILRLVRGSETLQTRVLDRSRHLVADKLAEIARLLRSGTGAQHDVDPRLATLMGVVSDHFGGRDMVVVSGFRPYSSRQFTAHSNHNVGRALDFTIAGVSNEALRDFCRTLRNVGVGYYPNSSFVHLDVRRSSAFWIDYAGPGQAPRYHRAQSKLEADEGAGEVEQVPSVDDPSGLGQGGPAAKVCPLPAGRDTPGKRDSTGGDSVFPSH